MNLAFVKSRQTKYGAYLSAYILVILAILAAGNYLADRYNKTFDATASKTFSLSDQTKKVIGGLKTDVKIYYFDTSDRLNDSRFGASPRDLLSRYDNLSHRVSVEYIDPRKTPKLAIEMKISSTGTTIVEAGGRREEAKSLSEEQITNALIRALKPDKRTACFLEGHGEHDLDNTDANGFSQVKESLESSNFTVKSISLLQKDAAVPADCRALVVAGPRNDVIDIEIQAIRKYVEGGGSALILLDPPTKGVATNTLVKLADEWGVKVNSDIVVDVSGIGQFFGADELSPLITKYESHAITREMRNVASLFPVVRSVEPGASKDKITIDKLFTTSARSYATTDFASGQIKLDPKKDKAGPFTLAVAGEYRTDKENTKGRFIISGTSRFVTNSTLGFPGGNRDLFLNIMSWLCADEDLISIRPKDPEDRRLSLSQAQMSRILYTSVIGFPLLIIAGGTWVWWRRR